MRTTTAKTSQRRNLESFAKNHPGESMRFFAFCTCLLLFVKEGALSNTTNTYSNLTTADMNVSTTQPSYISSPSAGSNNATMGQGTGTGTTIPQANTTNYPTNNTSPGDANRATTTPTHLMSNMTTITHSPDHMTSAPSNHTYNSTDTPEQEQPSKGGTATLLGFPNAVFWAVLAVVLFNQ